MRSCILSFTKRKNIIPGNYSLASYTPLYINSKVMVYDLLLFDYLIHSKASFMKHTLLLFCLLSISLSTLSSQIVYQDYGENGLRISLNENLPMDLDQDGIIDFYINAHENELGFSPIFANGCFASPAETAYTSFGAREIQIFEEGESIFINGGNMYDYIDDDRGSIYNDDGDFASSWEDGVDQYIGFALVNGLFSDGWMRIAINEEAQELVIYEIAFSNQFGPTVTGIKAGETGLSDLNEISVVLENLEVDPNPAIDFLRVNFDYQDNIPLEAVVVDVSGKEVYRSTSDFVNGKNTIDIQTTTWSASTYYLQLKSNKGIKTFPFNVSK